MLKKILLGFSTLCTLYFSTSAGISLYKWIRYNDLAWGAFCSWRIIEIDSSQFALEADYTFCHRDKVYKGMTRYEKPYHFNRPSAEKEIKKREATLPVVFFDRENPAYSTLQRVFPLKKCVYALLTLGILGYFVFLDRVLLKQGMQKA